MEGFPKMLENFKFQRPEKNTEFRTGKKFLMTAMKI